MNASVTMKRLQFAGYRFTCAPNGTTIDRQSLDLTTPGDYGSDPLCDGTFRMVPSGDVVDLAERNRRLAHRRLTT